MKTIKEILLLGPPDQIHESAKTLIREWSDDLTSKEILKTLNFMIYFGAGSEFVVNALSIMYVNVCEYEETALELLKKFQIILIEEPTLLI